ncbi:hypothetical protein [Microseira sp. BLCC-F43]|jgi:hypothetical protein|uniref:hypothetical protein n=1 Tax=Microseira sp. BLCC-F43 TaxID=3153602 RepID=UPI0035B8D938
MCKNIVTVTVAISFLVVSCTSHRVSQCNKLTEAINKADRVTQSAKTGLPADLIGAADGLDQIVQELKTVEVKDEKLRGLRGSFVLMYGDLSQLFRNTAIAISKQDRQGIKSYLESLQEANKQDRVLVQEINTYCAGK